MTVTRIKKAFKIGAFLLSISVFALLSLLIFADSRLSDSYYIVEGKQLDVNCQIPITYKAYGVEESQSSTVQGKMPSYDVNFKLLGLFPVKDARVSIINNMSVKLLGAPFGIKLYTDGVLVVDMTDVDTEAGSYNPAKAAGLRIGDTLKSINGTDVYSNEDVAKIIEKSNGDTLKLKILRGGKERLISVKPSYSLSAGAYRIGVWVRDSTAGIGTLTFYSPAYDVLCGLGHGVCDEDTGEIFNISQGELVSAQIVSCLKGEKGNPGELKGRLEDKLIGNLILNCECGVYARCTDDFSYSELISVALKQEVCEGEAYIYSTVDGSIPRFYSCDIKFNGNDNTRKTQNLIVTVTDSHLTDLTGGIVQGMSGSPIVQNGKLIGAVTHVFVNNPKKGYAVFAENMLKTAESAAKSDAFEKAS